VSVGVVGIYDGNFRQIALNTSAMRANVDRSARLFTHPLEDGVTVGDHKIIEAVRIELVLFLRPSEYKSAYQTLKQLFNADSLLTIQTRADTFPNMTIEKMPHEETVEVQDTIVVNVSFVEVQLTAAQYGTLPPDKVRDATQASTRNRGEQLPGTPPNDQGSWLYRTFKNEPSTN